MSATPSFAVSCLARISLVEFQFLHEPLDFLHAGATADDDAEIGCWALSIPSGMSGPF
jgi:hypothetical protein